VSNKKNFWKKKLTKKKFVTAISVMRLSRIICQILNDETVFIEQIQDGKLIDYLMASANHPIFKRYKLTGNCTLTAVVYNNLRKTVGGSRL
jgi:hypothetical protein